VVEEMFDEFSCIKKYFEGKLKEWNENSCISCDKWSDVLHYFKEASISVKNI
jgi:hypothetical protein